MSKVGTVVKVMHATHNGRFVKARPVYAKVFQEYVDGDVVLEGSTDVWQVRKSKDPKAQWETFVVPQEV